MPAISPHRCYVVIYEGSYSSMGTPNEIYYEGESEEEGERARAAAQAVVDKSREAYPSLHHTVYSLDDYISAKTRDAQDEGERRAQGSDF